MNHFVYSDPHFNHRNIINYGERPFADLEEMHKIMISRFNKVVSPSDKVYILGDFGMGNASQIKAFFTQLNGYKVLIMGNHDRVKSRNWWLDIGFQEVHKDPILIQKLFLLSHEPLEMTEDMPYYNIHGHLHQFELPDRKHFNASVEILDYYPFPVSKVVRTLKNKKLDECNIMKKGDRHYDDY